MKIYGIRSQVEPKRAKIESESPLKRASTRSAITTHRLRLVELKLEKNHVFLRWFARIGARNCMESGVKELLLLVHDAGRS